eukprot:TRINITY_DN710_c0_g1_i2.p1 TRINITY_DN710_c0_g1~~TRINITY_DN710_c0_g1_i2.p1  ORF type:complete len:856 (+),score=206.13 TRINITY_DN710_c0_g1_i2:52-2568(+)
MESALMKRSDTLRQWRKRWFVLRKGASILLYRSSEEDCSDRGTISLIHASVGILEPPVNQPGWFCFFIQSPRGTYALAAESDTLRSQWMAIIDMAAAGASIQAAAWAAAAAPPPVGLLAASPGRVDLAADSVPEDELPDIAAASGSQSGRQSSQSGIEVNGHLVVDAGGAGQVSPPGAPLEEQWLQNKAIGETILGNDLSNGVTPSQVPSGLGGKQPSSGRLHDAQATVMAAWSSFRSRSLNALLSSTAFPGTSAVARGSFPPVEGIQGVSDEPSKAILERENGGEGEMRRRGGVGTGDAGEEYEADQTSSLASGDAFSRNGSYPLSSSGEGAPVDKQICGEAGVYDYPAGNGKAVGHSNGDIVEECIKSEGWSLQEERGVVAPAGVGVQVRYFEEMGLAAGLTPVVDRYEDHEATKEVSKVRDGVPSSQGSILPRTDTEENLTESSRRVADTHVLSSPLKRTASIAASLTPGDATEASDLPSVRWSEGAAACIFDRNTANGTQNGPEASDLASFHSHICQVNAMCSPPHLPSNHAATPDAPGADRQSSGAGTMASMKENAVGRGILDKAKEWIRWEGYADAMSAGGGGPEMDPRMFHEMQLKYEKLAVTLERAAETLQGQDLQLEELRRQLAAAQMAQKEAEAAANEGAEKAKTEAAQREAAEAAISVHLAMAREEERRRTIAESENEVLLRRVKQAEEKALAAQQRAVVTDNKLVAMTRDKARETERQQLLEAEATSWQARLEQAEATIEELRRQLKEEVEERTSIIGESVTERIQLEKEVVKGREERARLQKELKEAEEAAESRRLSSLLEVGGWMDPRDFRNVESSLAKPFTSP